MMTDEEIGILGLAIFSFKKNENIFEKVITMTLNDLKRMKKESRNSIENIIKVNHIWNRISGKNVKIHRFSDKLFMSIFRDMLENDKKFEDNATELAHRFYNFEFSPRSVFYARKTAIFVLKIQVLSKHYVVFCSSWYSEIYRYSDGHFEKAEVELPINLEKGIIYPYQTDDRLHYDKAMIYQETGFSSYWLKAFGFCEVSSNQKGNKGLKIFLCHSSRDKEFVKYLAVKLKSDGFSVWYDDWEIYVGDSIVKKISEGIHTSDFLVVVLSKNSINSKWVKEELNAATIKNIDSEGAYILPVLIEKCDIPTLSADRRYANFSEDFKSGYQELVKAINHHSKRIRKRQQHQ